uniref:Cytoplasmic linker associated protein 1a n=1 Tax=Poecilia reticulata TaxID=8081 RepID=A0A3P9NSK4_POERE
MEPSMESCLAQVLQKDLGRRLQVGQEVIDYILDRDKSPDLEQDQTALDKMVDAIASSWVNSSNFKVNLLGLDLLSALVTRLQDRFRTHIGTGDLMDRLGDARDQVREQDQVLLLKIMEQAASPQYVWDRMLGGFKHKNNRTREGVCLCLIATLNTSGAQGLTLSKIVPHICSLLGDPTAQVRDGAMSCLVEIYRHVGERVRLDLSKKGLPQSRYGRPPAGSPSGPVPTASSSADKNFEDEESVDGGRSSSSSSSKAPPSGRRAVASSVRRPSSASSTKSTGEGPIQRGGRPRLSVLLTVSARVFLFGPDHSDLVADLLKELSNHNERSEERRAALLELLKVTREDSAPVWDEHFKTVLLLLLETLCDKDHTIRALALRVLKEILRNQPARFRNYAELTIMKTLEAHKDSHKEVVRAAEEAASTLAGSIHPEQCIKVLCPIVQTADYPINLAAIKMQTKVIERITKDSLLQLLPDIIPGLLQGYDNTESSVRKASVFCLVAIYAVIGEELKPHLAQLTGSKMKLLNLYIKRAQTTNSNSSSSSDVSSHS